MMCELGLCAAHTLCSKLHNPTWPAMQCLLQSMPQMHTQSTTIALFRARLTQPMPASCPNRTVTAAPTPHPGIHSHLTPQQAQPGSPVQVPHQQQTHTMPGSTVAPRGATWRGAAQDGAKWRNVAWHGAARRGAARRKIPRPTRPRPLHLSTRQPSPAEAPPPPAAPARARVETSRARFGSTLPIYAPWRGAARRGAISDAFGRDKP
jgi:hypothetical protein